MGTDGRTFQDRTGDDASGQSTRLGRLLGAVATRTPVEARSRALVKTVLYRGLMLLVTVAVALTVTGDVTAAVNIGLVANAVKTLTYYGYERLWAHVDWGVPA